MIEKSVFEGLVRHLNQTHPAQRDICEVELHPTKVSRFQPHYLNYHVVTQY